MVLTIYIHHYFSKSLFYKFAHNTIDRIFEIDEKNTGSVHCKYNEKQLKFIFNPIINYNTDGIHIVDFYTAFVQKDIDPTYTASIEKDRDTLLDTSFVQRITELIKDEKNWIITIFRMEKIIGKYEDNRLVFVGDLEEKLDKLKNHKIISDNIFLNDLIEGMYSNNFFCLTNTIYQWNEFISIRWHYEYKNIFEKLQQPYDLGFSVRHHKKNRIDILNGLAKLNNHKIYLSRVDNCRHKSFNNKTISFEKNINLNITKGNDFDDINSLENIGEYKYLDYLMRILPMAKMHILSESWDFKTGDYTSNYLSEKGFGFLLANIPFISTHSYPIDIMQKILKIENHPFYNEIKLVNGKSDKFVEFVESFMENFDENYLLCQRWVTLAHNKLMEKINNENSLLDLIFNDFKNNYKSKEMIKKLL